MTFNDIQMKILNLILIMVVLKMVLSQEIVITVQGKVRGESHNGYISYNGIPYANVTETDGKFKKAGLAPVWSGILQPSSAVCSASSEAEACLRVDVHVPTSGSAPWPVMAWVAGVGGHYATGKLVAKGIIVVVIHHRIGPSGFLCLNEEPVPGNAGAKDVVLALRWIRDNIVAFRGNPANVVVAGQGFGAAIVEALTLSKMAEGLFHGVILQSGTVLSPSAFNYDAKLRAQLLKDTVKYKGGGITSLNNESTATLAAKSEELDLPYFPFGMCVERNFKNEERLLTDTPINLLKEKKINSVPMIVGFNSDEAYIFVSNIRSNGVFKRMSRNISFLLPEELKMSNKREIVEVSRRIKETYFSDDVTMAKVLAYHRDAYFLNHIHRSVRIRASSNQHPIYYYQFSHSGKAGIEPTAGAAKTGAAHSDELAYLFSKDDMEGDDGTVQQRLVNLWTNFVKYLNPTPHTTSSIKWDPVEADNLRLLDIGTHIEMKNFPYSSTMAIWDDIYYKYYYDRYSVL